MQFSSICAHYICPVSEIRLHACIVILSSGECLSKIDLQPSRREGVHNDGMENGDGRSKSGPMKP